MTRRPPSPLLSRPAGPGRTGLVLALLLGACAPGERPEPGPAVRAILETPSVGTAGDDAADDPAVWASPRPVRLAGQTVDGFVAGTDKKAGLYIYGLDGRVLQFLAEGLLNNVDVVEGLVVDGRPQLLLGASDRTPGRHGIALFLFDPAGTDPANAVRPWGHLATDVAEPYGFCFGRRDGGIDGILIGKAGEVRQYRLGADAAGLPVMHELRRFDVGSISEGCAVDEAGDALYINQEDVGVWQYGFTPASGAAHRSVGITDGRALSADVEGATVLQDGARRYLIVSSQGDSTFGVWRIDGAQPTWAGRFRVEDGPTVDGVSGTDGIDALGGPVGTGFPEGLVVVQDDINDRGTQNFKYIDWRDIRAALGL
jgi:3-phytase